MGLLDTRKSLETKILSEEGNSNKLNALLEEYTNKYEENFISSLFRKKISNTIDRYSSEFVGNTADLDTMLISSVHRNDTDLIDYALDKMKKASKYNLIGRVSLACDHNENARPYRANLIKEAIDQGDGKLLEALLYSPLRYGRNHVVSSAINDAAASKNHDALATIAEVAFSFDSQGQWVPIIIKRAVKIRDEEAVKSVMQVCVENGRGDEFIGNAIDNYSNDGLSFLINSIAEMNNHKLLTRINIDLFAHKTPSVS